MLHGAMSKNGSPSASNREVGHKIKVPILWVQGYKLIMSHERISKNGSPAASNLHVGHKIKITGGPSPSFCT